MSAFRTAVLRVQAPLRTVAYRPLSTTAVRPKSIIDETIDKAKQAAEAVSKTAGNVLLKGIDASEKVSEQTGIKPQSANTAHKAENAKQATAETAHNMQNQSADELAGKAKGTAHEYMGKAQGTASEYTGKAKGTASEYAGKAKKMANEAASEIQNETGFASDKAKQTVNKIEGGNDRVGRPGY
ncbi:hypothetical protein BJ508DRAFT_415154 [Ascobolus immersus RN42]|uniref:LEA domain protein n=1 Tax=Ascobolus immersus RN42 TaxID=1160509 RepID=A0A3N4I8B9_ASCIM|nr:hypothetical protein BJ508DRAFT_415154 [Ascobolus immersus RN42]